MVTQCHHPRSVFVSLFANHRLPCRKLHNIANSVAAPRQWKLGTLGARQCNPGVAKMRARDVVLVLQEHGFRHKRTTGSHRQFEGIVGGKRRLVTVAGHEGADLARPTLASIVRQSGLPRRLFPRK